MDRSIESVSRAALIYTVPAIESKRKVVFFTHFIEFHSTFMKPIEAAHIDDYCVLYYDMFFIIIINTLTEMVVYGAQMDASANDLSPMSPVLSYPATSF